MTEADCASVVRMFEKSSTAMRKIYSRESEPSSSYTLHKSSFESDISFLDVISEWSTRYHCGARGNSTEWMRRATLRQTMAMV